MFNRTLVTVPEAFFSKINDLGDFFSEFKDSYKDLADFKRDVAEDGTITLSIEVPGFSAKDVKADYSSKDKKLSIVAEKEEAGSFSRKVVAFSINISQPEKVTVKVENGMAVVVVPAVALKSDEEDASVVSIPVE